MSFSAISLPLPRAAPGPDHDFQPEGVQDLLRGAQRQAQLAAQEPAERGLADAGPPADRGAAHSARADRILKQLGKHHSPRQEYGASLPLGVDPSEDAIAQPGPLVHAGQRGELGTVQALRAKLVDGVQLVGGLAAQLAAAGGEGVVELVVPPGLKSLLFQLAVGLGIAEGLGGPSLVGLVGDKGPAGQTAAEGRGGLDGTGGIEDGRHRRGLLYSLCRGPRVLTRAPAGHCAGRWANPLDSTPLLRIRKRLVTRQVSAW